MIRRIGKGLSGKIAAGMLAVVLGACATEFNLATQQEETLMYGTEKEVRIGDAVSRQLEDHYELNTDLDVNQRVESILERLVAVSDRKGLVYTVKVIDEESVNAVSLPGGYIYIFQGLLDNVENDAQLAGVMAHELGHITARHSIKRLQASYGYTLLQILAVSSGDPALAAGAQTIYTTAFLAYSRHDEFQADQLAVKYLRLAGYDPAAMTGTLQVLQKEQEKAPLRRISYFRTHPFISERLAIVRQAITGQLDFEGWLNLTGREDDLRR